MSQPFLRLLFAHCGKLVLMPDRWCTVTVTDVEAGRHSLDLPASSTFDAAHLYVTQANHDGGKTERDRRASCSGSGLLDSAE